MAKKGKALGAIKKSGDVPSTALYIRVSTDAQFEEGFSIEAQQKKLAQWCAMKDIEDYEFYIDGGFSGSNIERPALKRLIENIISNKIENVVVYKLDRLSRSQKDTVFLLEDVFIPHNANFISLNENFDTTTPYGKAMIGILSVFAQLERENIRDRTRMGMYERVKAGYWMGGGRVPFGYDYNRELNTLVPNADAEKVKRIFELYADGYSTTRIAHIFSLKSDKQVTDILDRETYLGNIIFRGERIKGLHEPIISEELFGRVSEQRRLRSKKNAVTSAYLLTGLVVCGQCGAKYRYQRWGKDSVKLYCYSQQSTKKNLIKDPNCTNKRLDAFELETLVIKDLFKVSYETASGETSLSPQMPVIEVMRREYAAAAEQIKRLYMLYAKDENELLLETIEERKSELTRLALAIENEEKLRLVSREISKRKKQARDLRGSWEKMSVHERQQVVRSMIDKIIVDNESIDIVYLI